MDVPLTLESCREFDRRDPLAAYRERFALPESGNIHFDANSMGAMPADAPDRTMRLLTDCWRDRGRRCWTTEDWMEKPRILGASIAHMLGADSDDVIVCDNTTVNLFKIISYAWKRRSSGSAVLTESHNFPTDLHVAQGFLRLLRDLGAEGSIRTAANRAQLLDMLDRDVAILYLTQTDYRSSERWNIQEINACARTAGALTVWDLSHSAGVLDIDLSGADFAVGCGYKYLCGGPGGPAFLFMNPAHQGASWPAIAGWMGHAKRDAFLPEFEPAAGIASQLTGTPQVIANEVFSAAADIWREVDCRAVAAKHESLTETLIAQLDSECAALGAAVTSPRDYAQRGGHVSFSHPDGGPVCEALADHGLVSSFRYPDSIRFGMSPLYHSHEDVWHAVQTVKSVLASERWRAPEYRNVSI